MVVAGRSSSVARMRAAEALGADALIETDRVSLTDYDFGKRPPNKILVTAPPASLPEAMQIVPFGGTVAFIGIAFGPEATISLDADAFHFKKLTLRASHASPGTHAAESIRILETMPELGRELISHRFGLEEIADAMATARDGKATVKKMVMVNE